MASNPENLEQEYYSLKQRHERLEATVIKMVSCFCSMANDLQTIQSGYLIKWLEEIADTLEEGLKEPPDPGLLYLEDSP